jgi:ABC-type transport system involved in cytochrome bd biosynthesis fused ATPase/permease subunit
MSPRARQAKGKARLNAYEELLREESTQRIETAEIYIAPGPRLGDVVVEARGLKKGYGENLLIEKLDFTLPRGGIVGVIGPNGAGKTTLCDVISGKTRVVFQDRLLSELKSECWKQGIDIPVQPFSDGLARRNIGSLEPAERLCQMLDDGRRLQVDASAIDENRDLTPAGKG